MFLHINKIGILDWKTNLFVTFCLKLLDVFGKGTIFFDISQQVRMRFFIKTVNYRSISFFCRIFVGLKTASR